MDISLGSVLTDSGTADGEVAALEERMFKRYRNWLDAWRDAHIKMFGESDPRPNIPSSSGLDWDRLHGGGAAMSDACNQAQAMNLVIANVVKAKYIERIGQDVWDALGAEERAVAVRFHEVYCHNHLRNSCARRAVKYEEDLLKDKFAATITEAEGEAESDQGAENEVESGADDEEGDGSDAEYDGDE